MTNFTYAVNFYVNGRLTSRLTNLSAGDAYLQGVPGEALNQTDRRWHLMLRSSALDLLEGLLAGESLRVCWQEPPENNWADTEHILIIKEAAGNDLPNYMPDNNLVHDVLTLINNMAVYQNNQNNLINNIRNRLVN